MRRGVVVGGIALTLMTGSALPARAETPRNPRVDASVARFRHLDAQSIGRIRNLPAGIGHDVYVNALVELSTAPVTAHAGASGAEVTEAAAASVRREVSAEQADKDTALRSAGATVEGRLSYVLNAVRVRVKAGDLGKVAAIPGVQRVQVARTVRSDNAAGGAYTGVGSAWTATGVTGAGTVIGVIDTGIDYTHADFGGEGTPAAFRRARGTATSLPTDGTFPSAKVVGGFDFVGDDYSADDPARDVPAPDPNPIPCDDHGTHVAGTAAGAGVDPDGTTYTGRYDGSTPSHPFAVAPGAAPEAKLRAYKVFGCDGTVGDDILVAAIDQAVADHVDVINMSLGSSFGTADDLTARAVDNATRAGVLVVASAGNDGPNAYLTGAPATADTAVAVAAMDASSPTRPGADLTLPGGTVVHGQNSNGATFATFTAGVTVASDPGHLGCDGSGYADAQGKVVITVRGTCDRVARAALGDQKGALAVIMINDGPGLPPYEGPIDGVDIPFIGVDGTDGADAVLSRLDSTSLTVSPATIANSGYARFASFTSGGPRRTDGALKPDLAAPGVSVASAGMGKGAGSVTMSGTSMAAPHVAGIAALVRQVHPGWTPSQVKAALVSTADPTELADYADAGGPARGGTGVVQAARATDTVAFAWTPEGRDNLSFGLDTLASKETESRTYKIANTSPRSVTYDLATTLAGPANGASVTVSPRTLTVPPKTSKPVTVTISIPTRAVAALPGAGSCDRGALARLAGTVVATPRSRGPGLYPLRTAFLLVPKPLSGVSSELTTSPRRSSGRGGTITLTNTGVHPGAGDVYAWTQSDPFGDVDDREVPDIIDVGVQSLPTTVPSDDGMTRQDRVLVFAVNTAVGTSTHATQVVEVLIDTNGDGMAEYLTIAADVGLLTTGTPNGAVGAFTVDAGGQLVDAWYAYAPANGSIEELPVYAGALGLTQSSSRFTFSVLGASVLGGSEYDSTAAAGFDAYRPAVSSGNYAIVGGGRKATVPVTADPAQLPSRTVKGWLVVTSDDAAGKPTADRVPLSFG
jgi:minor extracellular serine protease Vpr